MLRWERLETHHGDHCEQDREPAVGRLVQSEVTEKEEKAQTGSNLLGYLSKGGRADPTLTHRISYSPSRCGQLWRKSSELVKCVLF